MKKCGRCKEELPLEQFGKNRNNYQSYCKPCKVEWDKEYYARNQDRRDSVRRTNERVQNRNREFVWNYLSEHPCVDCGETDPVVLEFDHQGDKIENVGLMIQKQASIARLLAEIEKCEVRCCNCHRRKSARTLGWWRHEWVSIPSP